MLSFDNQQSIRANIVLQYLSIEKKEMNLGVMLTIKKWKS
jgi:hypothetical protein